MESSDTGTCSYLENLHVRGWVEWLLTAGAGEKPSIQESCTCTHSGPRECVSKGLEWAQESQPEQLLRGLAHRALLERWGEPHRKRLQGTAKNRHSRAQPENSKPTSGSGWKLWPGSRRDYLKIHEMLHERKNSIWAWVTQRTPISGYSRAKWGRIASVPNDQNWAWKCNLPTKIIFLKTWKQGVLIGSAWINRFFSHAKMIKKNW